MVVSWESCASASAACWISWWCRACSRCWRRWGLQTDALVEPFDFLFNHVGHCEAEAAVGVLFDVAAQADVVLVGGLLRLDGGDDQVAVADAAVDGGEVGGERMVRSL